MFLDASAIIGILAREPDAASLAMRLDQAADVYTSPIAIYEAVLGLARACSFSIRDADAVLDRFLEEANVNIIPVSDEIGRAAIRAFERFGKGRHVAALNMGDCFAYACARGIEVPLLFKGDDFPRTDVTAA
jgi:ribonuclease VapC